MNKINFNLKLLIALFVFGIIFCSISLVNHYNFRTYGWDLGINNNAIFDYAHFRWNNCMIMQPEFENILSDHFSLLPLLVSPFYWLFGSYTMLIFQIVSILLGGVGIYKYFLFKCHDNNISLLAMLHFFSIWGIYSALAFDYHDNVVAAMLVPWFIYFFEKKMWLKTTIFFFLICISKENMALWAVFISLGLFIIHRKDKFLQKASAVFSIVALLYFVFVIKVLIPSLANEGRNYLHFNYVALGHDFSEAIKTIILKPRYTFSLLLENHLNDPIGNGIKSELHLMVLLSGGVALLFRPQYLCMLIPVYAQKLFNDDFTKWGLNGQYSIEFVPILTLCLFSWINETRKEKIHWGIAAVMLTFICTIASIDNRISKWYNPTQYKFYGLEHYKTPYNVKAINQALKMIPDSAKVSAMMQLVPHLSFRDYIYQFPVINNADYILLLENENPYPTTKEELLKIKDELIRTKKFYSIYSDGTLLILKKL